MCSVVGYIGKRYSREFVMEGLARLEYRGYDSAGFACLSPQDNQLLYVKAEGDLQNLKKRLKEQPVDGFSGVGHTRWSTHGVSTADNAHPHFDCEKRISMVHNGIIENHSELKKRLLNTGHHFHSDTDTEVIAHLLESLIKTHKTLASTLVDMMCHLQGAYAFIAILQDRPDVMVLARKRSPLCIGMGDSEMFVASDTLAFAGMTNKVLFMPDESFALVSKDLIELYSFNGSPLPINIEEVATNWDTYEKQGHDHYMLKEIYEQKGAIHRTVDFLHTVHDRIWDDMGITGEQIKNLVSINLLGCGTSWHAAYISKFFFEHICAIPAYIHLASEFRHAPFFAQHNSLYIALSQSGETADTLEGMRLIKAASLPTVALTNVSSSTLVRECDGFILTQAGREIAVASTKSFSTQLTALYWLAHRIALEKKMITRVRMKQAEQELLLAAEILENCIETYKTSIVRTHAKLYAQYKHMIFLGRHSSYPLALEAALKLKEIAYIFATCYPAGELKHGPLALIDSDVMTFVFSHPDPLVYQKIVSNVQEVKARQGKVTAFAFEGQQQLIELADTSFLIPQVKPLLGGLAMTGLMQFLFYAVAKELNRPIDRPRNLAKSVTVE